MTRRIFSGEALVKWQRFVQQRIQAKQRNIPMPMTFDQWRGCWGERWHLRGHRRGQLVMSRFGDTGAYEVGNVAIISAGQNHREALLGSRNPSAKLTEADVVYIRKLHAIGMPLQIIAPMFGIHRSMVGYVVRGKNWSHVPGPRVRPSKRQGTRAMSPGSGSHRPAP